MEYHLNPEYKQIILHKGTCNGIPIKKFSLDSIDPQRKLSYLASLGLKDGSFTIGYTGRLVCDKGIVELVKAFTLCKIEAMISNYFWSECLKNETHYQRARNKKF